MGCHTWFYDKMNPQPTYEECKQHMLESINNNIEIITGKAEFEDEIEKKILTDYLNEIVSIFGTVERTLEYFQRLSKHIQEDKAVEAVKKKYQPYGNLIMYHNGIFYEEKEGLPHDVFRNHEYPDDVLTCYEDFEEFWNTHKCFPRKGSKAEEDVKTKMKKFWEEHPEGIVTFG